MADTTPLDRAHTAMQADPDDDFARLRFYDRLADAELYLMLNAPPVGEDISPELYDVAAGRFVLGFDREDRLTQFSKGPAPYAAMSGRALAQMLAPQGIGLGVNLDVAPSSILIPADAVAWLAETVANRPQQFQARISAFVSPSGLPETLISALDAKLASAVGLADCAYLVGVTYRDGTRGHLLGFVGAPAGASAALAQAASEALTFSGIQAGAIDVGFFEASDPVAAMLAKSGLRFDLPQPDIAAKPRRAAPGRDPDRPPILRRADWI